MARNEQTTAAFRTVTIEGRTYDLSHLDPFTFEFVVPEKAGKPPQIYVIDVQFSWHCFTRGIAAGENFPQALAYRRGRETRMFDERRYGFSQRLPGIIRNIGSRKCFHTGKGNFFTVEFIEESGSTVEYAIFFKVSRRGNRAGLILSVESSYAPDNRIPRRRPHPPRPIRFSVIAYNTATGKPIKQPK
jgi:hypothetical protein